MSGKQSILKVVYLDHVGISGETKLKEVEETEPLRCEIYGRLLKETESYITVLSYQEAPADLVATEHWSMTILKSTILKRIELEEKK